MGRGGPGQRKGGARECKVCAHPGLKEIEAMLLNGVFYNTIISTMQRNHPEATALTKPNLTTHKQLHLLNKSITRVVEGEDVAEVQETYLTGHYEARSLVIPPDAVHKYPIWPTLRASSLRRRCTTR